MEIEINPISEDTGGHTRSIVTNDKDRNKKERMELGGTYTLWNLLLNFNNTQVKLLIKRYSKMSNDSWSLPIGRKHIRITQKENEEEILNQEDMYKAISIKINYGNTFLFWRDITGMKRPDKQSFSIAKWNQRNQLPVSDKEKKAVNGFLKNSSNLNQKNTFNKKMITLFYNKENKLEELTKYKNYYNRNKRKKSYNREKYIYMESLDEKLQIILQRLDKIEANRSRFGDKIAKGEQKNQLVAEDWLSLQRSQLQTKDQKKNKENREETKTKQLKRVTKGNDLKDKRKTEKSLVELIKRNNNLGIRIACHNINRLKSNRLKLEVLSD
ncbi:30029_t:CDS:2 [Gigaspora margarita]|uniref:30029_t:CDS:1 n=1 Tax=Gigaspora margarita TaxID=4874 RepID=A0ABN7WEE7_GIGMA|nr:30029_t:CDS:2 [Gigaspora margarita]